MVLVELLKSSKDDRPTPRFSFTVDRGELNVVGSADFATLGNGNVNQGSP